MKSRQLSLKWISSWQYLKQRLRNKKKKNLFYRPKHFLLKNKVRERGREKMFAISFTTRSKLTSKVTTNRILETRREDWGWGNVVEKTNSGVGRKTHMRHKMHEGITAESAHCKGHQESKKILEKHLIHHRNNGHSDECQKGYDCDG